MKVAYLFPGQGAQYVSMGKDLYEKYPEAQQVIDQAVEILGYDIKTILFEGPADLLTQTKHAQVAIFVVSAALLAIIQKQFPEITPFVVAGLSLGEYTALYAGGYLQFADCLRLVQIRARLMHKACEETQGGMSVVLGLETSAVEQIIKEINLPQELWMANMNCPRQVAVSGTFRGLELLAEKAQQAGARKVVPLQVHGAFHSGLMQPAQDALQEYIDQAPIVKGAVPLATNITGDQTQDPQELKSRLKKQVTGSVYWQKSIEQMNADGVELYLEIGPGSVLSGLNRRIGVKGDTLNIQNVDGIEKLQDRLVGKVGA